jgi:hypothetical protein
VLGDVLFVLDQRLVGAIAQIIREPRGICERRVQTISAGPVAIDSMRGRQFGPADAEASHDPGPALEARVPNPIVERRRINRHSIREIKVSS